MPRRTNSIQLSAALLALAAGTASVLASIPANWLTDTDDVWTSTTAWSIQPNFPNNNGGDEYDVTINPIGSNNFVVTLDTGITIRSLTMGALPTVALDDQTLNVLGDFSVTGGRVTGDGGNGTLNVGGDATLTNAWFGAARVNFGNTSNLVFAGSGDNEICDTEIDHGGPTAVWQGSGSIRLDSMASTSRFFNRSKSVFTAAGDGTMSWNLIGTRSEFINEGKFVKDGGSAMTLIDGVLFKNATGTVEVVTGTLAMNAIDDYSSESSELTGGTWIIRENATLVFSGVTELRRLSGDVTLSGLNSTFAPIDALDEVTETGKFRVLDGKSFTTTSGLVNNGLVEVGEGSTLTIRTGLAFTPGSGQARVAGDLVYDNANITNLTWKLALGSTGRLLDQNGQDGLRNLSSIGPGGEFSLVDGRSYNFANGLTLANGTALRIGTIGHAASIVTVNGTFNYGGTVEIVNGRLNVLGNFNQNAPLKGRGVVAAPGGFTSNALISPGASPGSLRFEGDVTFSATSQLDIELGGTLEEIEYDFITITGNAIFQNNEINLAIINGYNPQVGDFFDVLRVVEGQSGGEFRINGLSQGRIQFRSNFSDGILRITVISVPAPSAAAAFGLCGVVAMRRRR